MVRSNLPRSGMALALGALALSATPALAQELRVQCYSDGNECEVTGEIAKRFEAANAGAKIVIDKVPYKAVVEQLPVQLAAGEGPDIARVTDLGGLNKYYLDLTPHLNPARQKFWNDNFASTLPWFRASPQDKGIYGLMSQLTVTGAFARGAGRGAAGACANDGRGGHARLTSMAAPSNRACLLRAMCRGEVILIRSK